MEITPKHLDQMRHAVGFFSDNPGYRNGYCTEKDSEIWNELKQLGFADGRERLGAYGFWVTDKGKELIGLDEQKAFKAGIDRQHKQNIEDLCEVHEIAIDWK